MSLTGKHRSAADMLAAFIGDLLRKRQAVSVFDLDGRFLHWWIDTQTVYGSL